MVQGGLGLPQNFLPSLLLRRETSPPRDMAWLALSFDLLVDGPSFSLPELSAIELGDVLVLGTAEQAFDSVKVSSGSDAKTVLNGQWLETGLKISEPIEYKKMTGESKMSEVDSTPVDESDLAARLPLEVTFEVGQISVSLAQLQRLQPGYVFDLSRPVEGAEVAIAVNGQNIGRGELVAAGDTLGVRVLNWDDNGLQ